MGTLLDVNDARIVHAKVRIENEKFKWAGESDDAGDFTVVVPPACSPNASQKCDFSDTLGHKTSDHQTGNFVGQ